MTEKEIKGLMTLVGSMTGEVKTILGSASVSPKAFVDIHTKVLNLMLDLRLERNRKASTAVTQSTMEYRNLRYEADELAGHQEATRLIKDKIAGIEQEIADLESYISHLKGLIDLMTAFEKMTRY